jgi:RNA polymerase sigma factor (sigma-70 family)
MSSGPTSGVRLLPEPAIRQPTAANAQPVTEITPALWKQVFRYAYSLVGNHAEAEDIAQETCVALFQEGRMNRTVEQVGSWMRTVARRAAYRQYHRTRPDLHIPFEITEAGETVTLDFPASGPSAEDRVIDEGLLRMGARVICSFPERDRQCIMMYFRGYDFAQIAATLHVSRWTARRVTLKALTQLQNRFDRLTK